MKNFKYLALLFLALGLSATSCESNRDDNLPDAVVYIVNDGHRISDTFYAGDKTAQTRIRVFRSGYIDQDVNVSVKFSEEVLTRYNSANGTEYKLLPAETYRVDTKAVTLSGDNRAGELYVTFPDPAALWALKEADGGLDNYVIPLELVSETKVNPEHSSILITPDVLEKVLLSFDQAGSKFLVKNAVLPVSYDLSVSVARPLKSDATVSLVMSQEAMDWYNASHNTSFVLPPSGFANLERSELVLASGKTSISTKLNLDPAKWDNTPCAVLIRLTSDKIDVDPAREFLLVHIAPASDDITKYEPLSRYDWKIDGRFYHHTVGGGSNAVPSLVRIIDGVIKSYWDGPYSSGAKGNPNNGLMPMDFTVDLGAAKTISGIGIRNREGSYCDRLKSGYFEVSTDGVKWGRVAEFGFVKGEVNPDLDYKYWFEPTNVRYIRMTVTASNSINGNGYHEASLAELYAYAPASTVYSPYNRLPQTGWAADANSYQKDDTCGKLIDGDVNNSFWEAGYNDGAKAPVLKLPFTIQVDMASVKSIDGIEMWRRNTLGMNESIYGLKSGTIWVSESATDQDWKTSTAWQTSGAWKKVGDFNFEQNASSMVGPFYYMLPSATNARYIRIHITDSNNKTDKRDTAAIGEVFAVTK